MHYSTDLMVTDHNNINRMLAVVRSICLSMLEGADFSDADFREIIDFVRNYADKYHHGKEEKYLFPVMVEKLGRVGENLVTHGMLVEHDLGRGHILALEAALDEYRRNPSLDLKLDILTQAMGYAHLLQLHIEKENSVVYPFAERSLSEEDFSLIDEKSKRFEAEQEEKGIQEKYLSMLMRMEEKYL